MFSDLVFVLNGVVPIFIVVFIGWFLKQKDFLTDDFVRVADKLVFKLLLPCFLFTKVADMDTDSFQSTDAAVVLFALAAVLVVSFGLLAVCTPLIRDSAKRGSFVQGVYRSNTAILGVPFAENLFGAEGARVAAILLAFVVPLYNVIAVIILSICDPQRRKHREKGESRCQGHREESVDHRHRARSCREFFGCHASENRRQNHKLFCRCIHTAGAARHWCKL